MANPIAVPGTVVPASSGVSPGGAQGLIGPVQVSADSGNIAQLGSDGLVLVPQSQITAVRLRSFNAVGNPNFEVDQRMCGTSTPNVGAGVIIQDRWAGIKAGTLVASGQQMTGLVTVPGTSFAISNNYLRTTITTAQASLGASDNLRLFQQVEGPALRELISDVTSLSLLVRSSVANLKFGVALQSPTGTVYSLVKLATIPSANTWTSIPLANLPIWSASATWPLTAGNLGYILTISLAAGSSVTTSANDVWVATSAYGAIGQSNLAATNGATFDVACVQHEPGAAATQFMDLDFQTNLIQCSRFYTKSYFYTTKAGTSLGGPAGVNGIVAAGNHPAMHVPFKTIMAKTPTVTIYSPNTGAANNIYNYTAAADAAVAGTTGVSDCMFGGCFLSAPPGSAYWASFEYVADTAW